jgi:hypothetical protein
MRRKKKLTDNLKAIEANGGKEISTVDPDSHLMHTNGDGRPLDACYNIQTVTDSTKKLIVDFDVTTYPDDKGALPKMTESAKDIMGVDEITVVADTGYYDGEDISDCEENGTITYVPKVADYAHAPDRNYDKSHFKYSAENDCYICPIGVTMPFNRLQKRTNCVSDRRYQNLESCKTCPNREKCSVNKSGRIISRNHNQEALDRNNMRMNTAEGRELFWERKKIVEHPFSMTKAVWGFASSSAAPGSERPPSSRSCFWRTICVVCTIYSRQTGEICVKRWSNMPVVLAFLEV